MEIKIKRLIFGILIIVNCIVIFSFSAQDSEKSQETSGYIVEKVANVIVKINNNTNAEAIMDTVSFIVRKMAHFSIYALLGIWLMCEASTFDITKKKMLLLCILCGAIYAITDEFHQSFVGGRSPEIRDVCIDTCGVMFGCFLVILLLKIMKNVAKKKNNLNNA